MKISTKLAYQYIAIFFNFSTTSNHLHPLQVENCDSSSRLVLDEDANVKFRLERGETIRTVQDTCTDTVKYVMNRQCVFMLAKWMII